MPALYQKCPLKQRRATTGCFDLSRQGDVDNLLNILENGTLSDIDEESDDEILQNTSKWPPREGNGSICKIHEKDILIYSQCSRFAVKMGQPLNNSKRSRPSLGSSSPTSIPTSTQTRRRKLKWGQYLKFTVDHLPEYDKKGSY
ncbi:unnamed protein product [Pieris macdunnoughi]|uniref:Uncharacterized protein n=1 Tax=Pieris macdunnoughi TaxID=345717 RepID=A0A821SLW1_9NEOP|nr:unnamed protein product [Pieris macdunnoughi]